MRTLHKGETYEHENGTIIEVVAPVYVSFRLPPFGYRVRKKNTNKEFYYARFEIEALITDKKLIRIW